jgi:hypothetical protein
VDRINLVVKLELFATEVLALGRAYVDAYRERTAALAALREECASAPTELLSRPNRGARPWRETQCPRDESPQSRGPGYDSEETDDGCSSSAMEAALARSKRSSQKVARRSNAQPPSDGRRAS